MAPLASTRGGLQAGGGRRRGRRDDRLRSARLEPQPRGTRSRVGPPRTRGERARRRRAASPRGGGPRRAAGRGRARGGARLRRGRRRSDEGEPRAHDAGVPIREARPRPGAAHPPERDRGPARRGGSARRARRGRGGARAGIGGHRRHRGGDMNTEAAGIEIRQADVRYALRLEYLTVGWNVVEGAVAITAALMAGSVVLLGFGIDSFVESASGSVLVWRLAAERRGLDAERLPGVSPGPRQPPSRARGADAFQTTAFFWLSIVTLAGIGVNALLGWWWADPVAALGMAWFIVKEGAEAWGGEEGG